MARGRKPKTEEVEEVVEVVETEETMAEETENTIEIAESNAEIPIEKSVEEVVDTAEKIVEESVETNDSDISEDTTKDEIGDVEVAFNSEVRNPECVKICPTITLHNFTTVYRDASLTYPLIKAYGDATLIDVISPKVLCIKVMFNGRFVMGYIERNSVR